jgi:hypothetical protein
MAPLTYRKTVFFLGLAGLLFSGYLSAFKLFNDACALNEPCPYFLGISACWYGFGMFLVIFSAAILSFFKVISIRSLALVSTFVSFLGIVFAGSFTIPEIGNMLSGIAPRYALGLPSCAYGLVFYTLVFILSLLYLKKNKN